MDCSNYGLGTKWIRASISVKTADDETVWLTNLGDDYVMWIGSAFESKYVGIYTLYTTKYILRYVCTYIVIRLSRRW